MRTYDLVEHIYAQDLLQVMSDVRFGATRLTLATGGAGGACFDDQTEAGSQTMIPREARLAQVTNTLEHMI